jgi:hypothetical protein
LLVDVPDLEPDIRVGERIGRVAENAVKAGERLVVLALLLVYYPETKQDLISFVKV